MEDGGDGGLEVPRVEVGIIGFCVRCGEACCQWIVGGPPWVPLHLRCAEAYARGERVKTDVEPVGAYARRRKDLGS
jgi:hypothetical protein